MIIVQMDSEQLSSLIQSAVVKAIAETPSQAMQAEPETLLTVKDAANFLSLSVPTIYTLISKGEIPSIKKTKRVYFDRKELIDYLKTGRKKTNKEIESEAEDYVNKKRAINHTNCKEK